MSQKIIGKKALVVNSSSTNNIEAVIGGMVEGESGYSMILNFGADYSLVFDSREEWDKFIHWVVNLSPNKVEKTMLIPVPILKKKDLIRWFDGGIGLVINVGFTNNDWAYTIVWQDTKQQTTMTSAGLKDRELMWEKINYPPISKKNS